jgi:hypothetical protein
MFEPVHLKLWTMPDSYFGEVWPDYYSAGVGQSRDSDSLERSNFVSMLEALGGESETVFVVRESHWAVGWVEWIAIHATDETALRKADRIVDGLESYPVINESHWSELEQEEANEVWRECYSNEERVAYMREHPSQFEFHSFADMLGCARGRYFAGYASELLN